MKKKLFVVVIGMVIVLLAGMAYGKVSEKIYINRQISKTEQELQHDGYTSINIYEVDEGEDPVDGSPVLEIRYTAINYGRLWYGVRFAPVE